MDKYKMVMLLDIYGSMLTVKQYKVMSLYFNEDYSLAEIGEELGISRQGASDFIKRSKNQLLELDDKLQISNRYEEISRMLLELKQKMIKEGNVSKDIIDSVDKIIEFENS